jgi:hypothetical protein
MTKSGSEKNIHKSDSDKNIHKSGSDKNNLKYHFLDNGWKFMLIYLFTIILGLTALVLSAIAISRSSGSSGTVTSDIVKIQDTNSDFSTTLKVPSLTTNLDLIFPSTQGETNQVLTMLNDIGQTGWVKDSIGVSSDEAKLNSIAKYANNDGQSIKETGISIDDSNNITGIASLSTHNIHLSVDTENTSSIFKDFSTLGDISDLRQDVIDGEDNRSWGVVFTFIAGSVIKSGDLLCFKEAIHDDNQVLRVFPHVESAASLEGAGIVGVAQSSVTEIGAPIQVCTSGITTVRCIRTNDLLANLNVGSVLTGGSIPGTSYANAIYGPLTASVGFALESIVGMVTEKEYSIVTYVSTGFQGI